MVRFGRTWSEFGPFWVKWSEKGLNWPPKFWVGGLKQRRNPRSLRNGKFALLLEHKSYRFVRLIVIVLTFFSWYMLMLSDNYRCTALIHLGSGLRFTNYHFLINYCFNPENELENSFKVNKHVNYAKPPSVKPSGSQSSRKIEIRITIQIRKVGLSIKRKASSSSNLFINWPIINSFHNMVFGIGTFISI